MKKWPQTTIGSICEIRGGGTPSKSVTRYWQGSIPWVSPKDVKSEIITDSIDRISEEAIDRSATSLIPEGSVLIVVRSGILARTVPIAIAGKDLTINQDLKALCPSRQIDSRFLHYILTSRMDELLVMVSRGATVHRLMTEQIRSIEIPVPPLPEQQRIVGLLDEAMAGLATARANTEANLQNARALFESHLQSIFSQRGEGWVGKSFDDCIQNVRYTVKIQRKQFQESGRFPIISQEAEFINGRWDDENDLFRIDGPLVVFGDHTRCLKYIDFDFVLGADGVKLLKPHAFLSARYFYYALLASPVKHLGYARHYRLLTEKQIYFPPLLKDQQTIVTHLDALAAETRRLESLYTRKLDALDALKKSLLHQAFSGKL